MEKIIDIVDKKYPWSTDLIERLQVHSPWTYLHSMRVAEIAYELGDELKFESDELVLLAASGLLHDVGKIYVDNKILNSDQFLLMKELEILRDHVKKGYTMVNGHDEQIAKIISAHHEYQNSPYPIKNKKYADKSNIDLEKIIALSDTVDSAMSERPYKKAKNKTETFDSLLPNYDPDILRKAIDIRMRLFEK